MEDDRGVRRAAAEAGRSTAAPDAYLWATRRHDPALKYVNDRHF
jgi:hypothetical protein